MIPDTAEIGFDIPARPGDALSDVMTPALVIDLDAFDRNIARMRAFVTGHGLRLRAHAKTHKSADIARIQMQRGGACGICCQKVSEAEALVRAGITDVLVSNEIHGPRRAARLAALAGRARVQVCVDDAGQVATLSRAAEAAGTRIGVLVEIDVGAGRCGLPPGPAAVELARRIDEAPGLSFNGLQAYQGALQHIRDPQARAEAAHAAARATALTRTALTEAGFACETIGGAGTGSFTLDAGLGEINELQCGSYVFMDADYDRVTGADGSRPGGMENALFVMAEVMSRPGPDRAICDAGLKALSVDSGLPRIDRDGLRYTGASDEHGTISDPGGLLAPGDRVMLVPGHCDPTCNLYDWYVGLRGGVVETLWPVTARGKLY